MNSVLALHALWIAEGYPIPTARVMAERALRRKYPDLKPQEATDMIQAALAPREENPE